ncbi:putative membrane protein [Methanocalculus alkaliphilus]|uniref:heparan-alpha-glucosaminide N-acetyltransferase n=1 Tax=Methanocalculus alkaliphilus TaxID=768730 RepID=UPI0020A1B771|nr:heparan-alpha-glucosaminide N-acetyltransferase [Methanocalculus alkaliphilus]MCP1715096.1 putative membrane protein [Methanocalculus alkaliphilus]
MGSGVVRDGALDAARGTALTLMIIYHILFDLAYFGIYTIHPDIWYAAIPIAGTFIFIAGISLHLKAESLKRKRIDSIAIPLLHRGLFLLLIGAGITVATWIYPREGFIIWGILHLIGAGTILAIPFLRFGRWNILPAAFILLIWFFVYPIAGPDYLIPLGIHTPGLYSLDYLPIIPWFAVMLLGLVAGSILYTGNIVQREVNKPVQALAFIGRHTLIIYLIHQPIIIGIILILKPLLF